MEFYAFTAHNHTEISEDGGCRDFSVGFYASIAHNHTEISEDGGCRDFSVGFYAFTAHNHTEISEDGLEDGLDVTSTPDNWYFRDSGADGGAPAGGAPAGGPLVILDLDGIISNATHRQHYLRGAFKDFRGFFTAATADPPYESGLALAASIADDHTVAILTARPHYMVDDTRRWLAAHDVRHDLLILRPEHGRGSRGASADFKRHELSRLRAAGYEITAAIDDDERIIEMYRSEGVFALYVHSGYYERDDAARVLK